MELIKKKEFAAAVFDPEHEVFIIHVAALSVDSDDEVHLSKSAQIAHLKMDKTPIKVSSKYADFADIFLSKLATGLPEHTRMNNHAIKIMDSQQPLFGPIYSLGPVELKMLKAYIKNNLANGFIKPSKSPAEAPILFDKKPEVSLRLCVDYQGLNNLIIKN